ncbi:AlkZ family DNA glycosylase [Leifsonia sp. ZF2019]|uniref:winged helix DNA-binding domain-containing protein n=1 Tax=Leifsonia sp. ZF2019 TaxID=2781978 RepID=UPI001CC11D65|nr:winged helix DNA-binding domain-containing protein [Leifsonia sp. ZF2019]UAJ81315.1 AlkZ family DNA glycosylase [Leifsonia sp. ZF2019]
MPARRADLLRMRRLAHAIDGPREQTPADVTRRMLAVQAQDFGAACWAIAFRTVAPSRNAVLADLDAGRIVRSWPMRGTLHFVPPEDLRWMLSVTTERMLAGLTRRHRQLELEPSDFTRARDLLTSALAGGRALSRADAMELWESAGIATGGQRGYHLLYYLAQTGVICWGPTLRTQQALVLVDEWAPPERARRLDPDEAGAEYLRRYLAGHGPATVKDFVWWTKGTLASARAAVAILGDELTTLEVDGVEYLLGAELADRAASLPATRSERGAVQLLPAFDEYLLGYQDRAPVIDDALFERVVPGKNGVFSPVLVTQGRVAGTWRRAGTAIETAPFEPLSGARAAAAERAAAAYLRFAG